MTRTDDHRPRSRKSAGVLLCDLDDTLLDNAATYQRWARRFAFNHANGAMLEWLLDKRHHVRDFGVTRDFIVALRDTFELHVSPETIKSNYEHFASHDLQCSAPTRRALVAARSKQWRIAIVTNGGPSQSVTIRRTGIDSLVEEIRVLNKRLDHSEGFARLAHELRNLNESLQALAYAALGREGPQVRRRRTG